MTPPFNLDILRGWPEQRDQSLRVTHVLPALARLGSLEDNGPSLPLYGPNVIIGRHRHATGPVDVMPWGLSDAQRFHFGAPHIQLTLVGKSWHLKVLAQSQRTKLNGRVLASTSSQVHRLDHGDRLDLGQCSYFFETEDTSLERWRNAREDLFKIEPKTALFLKRSGGPCGPRFAMENRRAFTIGRSFAPPGPHAPWGTLNPPDWDLADLPDVERATLAFRHARIGWVNDNWEITPLSPKHPIWVNRVRVKDATILRPRDEIALGGVLFCFHSPNALAPSSQRTMRTPNPLGEPTTE